MRILLMLAALIALAGCNTPTTPTPEKSHLAPDGTVFASDFDTAWAWNDSLYVRAACYVSRGAAEDLPCVAFYRASQASPEMVYSLGVVGASGSGNWMAKGDTLSIIAGLVVPPYQPTLIQAVLVRQPSLLSDSERRRVIEGIFGGPAAN